MPSYTLYTHSVCYHHIMTERINITLPPELLAVIDEAAARQHLTRSGFLRAAALDRLAADGPADVPDPASGGAEMAREEALAYVAPHAVMHTRRADVCRAWPPSPEAATVLLAAFFAARPDVDAAYLFGSVSRGEAHSGSDLDVAVLLADEAVGDREWDTHAEILARLASLFATEDIDLVVLNSAPDALAMAIVESGTVVAGETRPLRVRFETSVLARATDVRKGVRRPTALDRIRGRLVDG